MNTSDWKKIISTVAPGLATMLGGPLAGTAVAAISQGLLGKPLATSDELASAIGPGAPDTLVKLKQIESDMKAKFLEAGIQMEDIGMKDRASARKTMVQRKSWTPAVLSWLIVLATLSLYTHLLYHGAQGVSELILGRILGTLDTSFGVVLAFWLGTSYSSRQKDDTIKLLSQ